VPVSALRIATSRADRLAVTAVAHAATAPEQSLAHFQARRLAHPRRALATWWLLEEEGRAVCSLVCHPLEFSVGGRVRPGYGIGAVATVPEARRRGHARALCEAAIERAESEGRGIGLLYSAIAPAYYERLGFRALPAWRLGCDRVVALAGTGAVAPVEPLDPWRERATLADLYEWHHGRALHLHRDAAGYERSLALDPGDLFFGLGDPLRAYARVHVQPAEVDVVELVAPAADRAPLLRALAEFAARLPRGRIAGWFDPDPDTAAWFRDEGRTTTLPMVRGTDPDPEARFLASDYF
jgi:predicted N-acetyltransferase YhbS